METRDKLLAIARAARDKKANDIVIIDMRKASSLGDYCIIASGESGPQIRAISDNIIKELKGRKVRPWHVEGDFEKPTWILIDYGDIIAHIFHEETRRFYNLERLWGDAPQRRFTRTSRKAKAPINVRKKRRKRKT